MVRNARAADYEERPQPVVAIGNIYPDGHLHTAHRHRRAQLLYSSTGVMIVGTGEGTWVVPPQRGIWIPPGVEHDIRMAGKVSTHSIYVRPEMIPRAPTHCQVVEISPLLRNLLIAAVDLPVIYETDVRSTHLMGLLLHEIVSLSELPLNLPFPRHERLAGRCRRFVAEPSANDTIAAWSDAMHMSRRSFTRLFRRETGLSFVEWRQRACLVAAVPRLIAGEPVTSVALDLGYSSPAAFSAMFKRALGLPPARYLLLDSSDIVVEAVVPQA